MAPNPPPNPTTTSKSRRSSFFMPGPVSRAGSQTSQSIVSRIGSIIMGNTHAQNSVVPVCDDGVDKEEVASRLKTLMEQNK